VEGINTFNEISSVNGTTKRRLTADKNAGPKSWFGGQKTQQVGAFFLKFLRLTPKRGEGKQRKIIIDRVGERGAYSQSGGCPNLQFPVAKPGYSVAVPSGRANGRPPTSTSHMSQHITIIIIVVVILLYYYCCCYATVQAVSTATT
jgi:hypothetical protein